MYWIVVAVVLGVTIQLISDSITKVKKRKRVAEMKHAEQELERQKKVEKLEKEQTRLAKEQEKQARLLAKHEEQIMKLEARLAAAESEIAYNQEQRDRLFELLDIEELERDSAIRGSNTWQKHHRKVISLESQIHTVQKRIDKAKADKKLCESKLA